MKALVIVLSALSLCIASAASAADGKELFTKFKCQKCHAVKAAGIDVAGGDDEEEEDERKSPDLSGLAQFHDQAFLKDYLMKKVEHAPHAGNDHTKKHKTAFKGSEQELNDLVTWLLSQK